MSVTSPFLLVPLLWVSSLSACAGAAPAPGSAGQAPAELAAASPGAKPRASSAAETTRAPSGRDNHSILDREAVGDIRLGMRVDDLVKAFGPPTRTDACLDDATCLYWKHLEVEVLFVGPDPEARVAKAVTVNSPSSLKTSRGVGIGSRVDAIREAYGEHVRREGTNYVVGGEDGLVFDASGDESDGKVVAIHWGGGTRP